MSGHLAENIVYFGRALRKAGLPVGPKSILEAVEAVDVAGIGSREDLYWILHGVMVNDTIIRWCLIRHSISSGVVGPSSRK